MAAQLWRRTPKADFLGADGEPTWMRDHARPHLACRLSLRRRNDRTKRLPAWFGSREARPTEAAAGIMSS